MTLYWGSRSDAAVGRSRQADRVQGSSTRQFCNHPESLIFGFKIYRRLWVNDRVHSLIRSCNAMSNLPWPYLIFGFSIFHFLYNMKCDYWLGILFFHFLLLFNVPAMNKILYPPNPRFPMGSPNTAGWIRGSL